VVERGRWPVAYAPARRSPPDAPSDRSPRAMPRIDERYIPVNVTTYREGFRRLRGWTCVSCLSFLTGALLVAYELAVINVEDRDFRDLLFDYRVTQPGIM
jgi:hypothetical protein